MRRMRSFYDILRIERGLWIAANVTAICMMFVGLTLALHAQASPSSLVGAAVNGHGTGWQDGAVKTWMAVGTLTTYRYDAAGRQTQETFPMTLMHAADPNGSGSQGDKLQRLVFKPLSGPPVMKDASHAASDEPYSPQNILTKVGTDGVGEWHSAGPLSTAAAGRSERFIEAQTDRSLEALFNYQKHARNLKDVTSNIRGQGPGNSGHGNGAGNAGGSANGHSSGHGDSHVTPNFMAAQNRHVIEMSDGTGSNKKTTRYYIDDSTSLVTRMEFDYGAGKDPFSGKSVPLTEVYEFSDYRGVPLSGASLFSPAGTGNPSAGTVKFPFLIDRYILGQKVETMAFSQVLLNQNLRPENFRK